ncbi:GNAT family N-acetyltransferase [Psychroserpens damuponensis]|uniref:GNAT family N-acetyltransferase n=1 Tax=Psychroserpens damuponensis TaxID=943936 RepID=UPI00058F1102|nr:GNAT family N-acetyltransferase [Psychroserpens damuponensis]
MTTYKHTTQFYIKEISAKETYAVRQPILREGQPLEDCEFSGDHLETTIHLGLYVDEALIGIASFLDNCSVLFSEEKQYQLRGMAILKAFQGQQFGEHLIKHGERVLKEKGIYRIWCNARETAIHFYTKNEYQIIGDPFEIENVGTHYVMTKVL